ncbi:MAG TPA: rhodanese-like domain-containing protein [Candidatus Binataceae bacterium]|nr:rhodanese-like domain-containing protein [Candidatus Binataceae bacterium]
MLLLLLLVMLFACGSGSADSGNSAGTIGLSHRFLIEPSRLPSLLRRRDVILLSAQSSLEVANPGFVNGAIPVDVDAIADFGQMPDAFTDLAGWAERFGALGITTQSTVIIYDDGELKFASRVRFLLDYFGVRRAFLLNGGFNALGPLIASGKLVVTDPGPATPATFAAKVQDSPIHLVDQQYVLSVLDDPTVTLIDVRTPAEFAGCLLLPGIKRGGHIPGARNLPIENLLTPQADNAEFSFLDTPAKLHSIFRAFELRRHDRIVVYCQDGAKSSLAALSLIEAGYTNVSLYYLSYLDWQTNQSDLVESIEPCM